MKRASTCLGALVAGLFSANAMAASAVIEMKEMKTLDLKTIEAGKAPGVTSGAKANVGKATRLTPSANAAVTGAAAAGIDGLTAEKAAAGETCSSVLNVDKMTDGSNADRAQVEAAINEGFLKRGKCAQDPQTIKPVAKERLVKSAIFARQKGSHSVAAFAEGFQIAQRESLQKGEEPVSLEQATAIISSVAGECGWTGISASK